VINTQIAANVILIFVFTLHDAVLYADLILFLFGSHHGLFTDWHKLLKTHMPIMLN
jgi:hypothetical protein